MWSVNWALSVDCEAFYEQLQLLSRCIGSSVRDLRQDDEHPQEQKDHPIIIFFVQENLPGREPGLHKLFKHKMLKQSVIPQEPAIPKRPYMQVAFIILDRDWELDFSQVMEVRIWEP